MSATSELILEQIREVTSKLTKARQTGESTEELEQKLVELNQKLDTMQQAQLLKG